MLTERKVRLASRGQQLPQFGWRDESDAEQRHASIEQQRFDCISLTAKGHCHQRGLPLLPGDVPSGFKPWEENGLPRRTKGRSDVQ